MNVLRSRPALVSTITPVHNREELIAASVMSVVRQSYRPVEVIVVDDASDDNTPNRLRELAAAHPDIVRVFRRDRTGGPGAAREDGRRMARGEYIQYLDSDDVLHPTKFERQVAAFEDDRDLGIVYGDTDYATYAEGVVRQIERWHVPPLEFAFPTMLAGRPWRTFAALYRRSVVDRAGPWLPTWNEEDWEYDARCCSRGIRVRKLGGVVGTQSRRRTGHLSGMTRHRRRTLLSQSIARPRILRHALQAGVETKSPEFQRALRHMFLLARQCGSAGLDRAASGLLRDVAAWAEPGNRADVAIYGRVARIVGERPAGVAAASFDRMRALWRR